MFQRIIDNGVATMKKVLESYELVSGQKVSTRKSASLFSKTVGEEQKRLVEMLGVTLSFGNVKYLGLPYIIGMKKREVFGYIRDHVAKKVAR